MAITHVTELNFQQVVNDSNRPVLVDFWAPWCGPCRMIAPVLEELARDLGDNVVIAKLNVDENPRTASQYKVMSIPTLKLFKNGKVVHTTVGLQSKQQLKQMIQSNS